MSIYVPNNHNISELCCHGNLLTSSKTAPLCLRQVLVVKAMPHGSEKSPEKNRNEIHHSLCMPQGRVKIVANYEENDT